MARNGKKVFNPDKVRRIMQDAAEKFSNEPCPCCKGKGKVRPIGKPYRKNSRLVTCPICRGKGKKSAIRVTKPKPPNESDRKIKPLN